MAELLAVYGTLMSGQSYDGRPDVETLMRSLGPCRIPGVLYSEGDYPWLVPAGPDGLPAGEVSGELYEILGNGCDDDVFDLLDAYENEGRHTIDGAGRYARVRLRLLEPDLEAWVYVWEGADRGEPIDGGDWRAWLAGGGAKPRGGLPP